MTVSESTKHAVDAVSIMTVVGTLADILPSIAAILSIIWSVLRIYEMDTVQSWLKKRRKK